MADISLVFDVAGGSDINQGSGKKIKEQLEGIVSAINRDPFKIKFKADEDSLAKIKEEVKSITDSIGGDRIKSIGYAIGQGVIPQLQKISSLVDEISKKEFNVTNKIGVSSDNFDYTAIESYKKQIVATIGVLREYEKIYEKVSASSSSNVRDKYYKTLLEAFNYDNTKVVKYLSNSEKIASIEEKIDSGRVKSEVTLKKMLETLQAYVAENEKLFAATKKNKIRINTDGLDKAVGVMKEAQDATKSVIDARNNVSENISRILGGVPANTSNQATTTGSGGAGSPVVNSGSFDSAAKSAVNLENAINKVDTAVYRLKDNIGVNGVADKLKDLGLKSEDADEISKKFDNFNGIITDVKANFVDMGEEGKKAIRVVVDAISSEDPNVKFNKAIDLLWDKKSKEWVQRDSGGVNYSTGVEASIKKAERDAAAAEKASERQRKAEEDAAWEFHERRKAQEEQNYREEEARREAEERSVERSTEKEIAQNDRLFEEAQRNRDAEEDAAWKFHERQKAQEEQNYREEEARLKAEEIAIAKSTEREIAQYDKLTDAREKESIAKQKALNSDTQLKNTINDYRNSYSDGTIVSKDDDAKLAAYIDRLDYLYEELDSGRMKLNDFKEGLAEVKSEFNQTRGEMNLKNGYFDKDSVDYSNALKAVADGANKAEDALRKYSAAEHSSNSRDAYNNIKILAGGYKQLKTDLENGKISQDEYNKKIASMNAELTENIGIVKNSGKAYMSFGNQIKKGLQSIGSMFSLSRIIMELYNGMKKLVSASIEFESTMAQLQIVTKTSSETLANYSDKILDTASRMGVAVKDLVDATTTYARLGYTLEESSTLAELTGMLQGVGDIEAQDAQNAITGIIKAFDMDIGDVESMLDRLVIAGRFLPDCAVTYKKK